MRANFDVVDFREPAIGAPDEKIPGCRCGPGRLASARRAILSVESGTASHGSGLSTMDEIGSVRKWRCVCLRNLLPRICASFFFVTN